MKKILYQVSLILLIISIGIFSVFITEVNADSIAGLNVPSTAKVGSSFRVALILPSDAYSAQATITVKFSDGTTSSQNLVYMTGMSDFPNHVTFNASKEGTATISATGIVISDSAGNTKESNGSKTGTINIIGDTPTPPPAENNPGSSNSNSSNNNNYGNNSNSDTNNTQVTIKDVNETVYANDSVNVRKSYSTSSAKIGKVAKGTKLKRTGITSNGWSRVEYSGQTAYISSQYLTTEEQEPEAVEFKATTEKVYAIQNCNLRKSWSTDSEKVGYLTEGQEVTRTGYANNGWSRIEYNGQTVYVASRLLTVGAPEDAEKETEENPAEEGELTEEEILAQIQEEVGILPEVGNNIAIYLYAIITVIALIGILGGAYYIRKK